MATYDKDGCLKMTLTQFQRVYHYLDHVKPNQHGNLHERLKLIRHLCVTHADELNLPKYFTDALYSLEVEARVHQPENPPLCQRTYPSFGSWEQPGE